MRGTLPSVYSPRRAGMGDALAEAATQAGLAPEELRALLLTMGETRRAGLDGWGDKQGSSASGKWRSLAGLLPGGGLKAGPPWTPPGHQSSPLFHPPGAGPAQVGPGASEERRRPVQYGVGLRPSLYTGSLEGA